MAPKTVEVESQEELDNLVKENKIAIVGFFQSGENSKGILVKEIFLLYLILFSTWKF